MSSGPGSSGLTFTGPSLGAGGNAKPAGMLLAVFAALEGIKTDLARVLGPEFRPGKGLDRTDIHTNMALPAGLIHGRPRLKGSIRQDRNETDARAVAIGQEQAAFADPAQPGEVCDQFMGNDPFQLIKIVGRRTGNGKVLNP